MISFYEMTQILEAAATDDTLWKYYSYVEKNPNLDDLKTLISMIQQTYAGTDATGMIADFLGGIGHKIIPSLPEEDQESAKEALANLEVHPRTDLYMRMNNYKKFHDVQEFENFILQVMQNYRASSAMRVVQDPANKYWWDMTSDEIKQQLKQALEQELAQARNQPSLGQTLGNILRNQIRDNNPDKDWDAE